MHPRLRLVLTALLLACPCASARAQLQTRASTKALIYPEAMVAGDFNNDGKPDLAVASVYNLNGVTVLLGNGDGTFRIGSEFTVGGGGTWSITAADFNGDGNLDLAVVQFLNATVSVLLGNGDGTFQSPVDYTTQIGPQLVASGDFNGDKHPDLVVLEQYETCSCFGVFLNNGDGTFGPRTDTPIPLSNALAVGDFNGDGKLDVVVASVRLQVFLGNGDGTFTAGPPQPITGGAGSVTVADLRKNGKLDVVIPGAFSFAVFLGNGDGTFAPEVDYPTPFPEQAAVADFNGDGKPDIVVSNFTPHGPVGVSLFLGNGDGTFQNPSFYPAGAQANPIAVSDFNGDKQIDVAVADPLSSRVFTMLNTGVVSFSPTTALSFPDQLFGTTSPPQTVTLTNNGSAPLTISSMKVKGQYGMTSTCGSSVAPGRNCHISVSFSPKTQGGKPGTISIIDSASTKPQVIELTGQGTVVQLSPSSLNFGTQKVGTKSPPQNVTLTNKGSAALNITQIIVLGFESREFPYSDNCPTSLAAGAQCTITVWFDPAAKGSRTSHISVSDSGGSSPQLVPLSGTGT